jgi:hypothetical protein
MARSITKYGVTSQGAAFTAAPVMAQQNYVNFAVVGGVTNGEATLENTTVPLGYGESIRFASKDVNNVYSQSKVDAALQAPTKRGRSVLISLDEVWKESDSADATYEVALPMHGHIVLRVPNNSTLTYDDVLSFFMRLTTLAFGENDGTSARLRDILKGALIF